MSERLDRSRIELEFDERFGGATLDPNRWIAHYLPEWTTPDRSAARYDVGGGVLRLRIDADQPAWLPEEGELRVSSLQTGTFSGPAGSHRGQCAPRPEAVVRTPQPLRRLYTPVGGLVEAEMRTTADPTCMAAFWLIGLEDDGPQSSGELCVCELFGRAMEPGPTGVNIGVKAHGDRRLTDDMTTVTLDLDATAWHTYAVEWTASRARFFVDDKHVRTVDQGIAYPLELLVDLFEFPEHTDRDPSRYPKTAEVRAVRGYRRV